MLILRYISQTGLCFPRKIGITVVPVEPSTQVSCFAEKDYIKYKLEKNNWNVSKTADDIDIQRSHLYSKIEKYGLKRAD